MPIVPGNPEFPNQYGWSGNTQPYSTQLNFGQMIGEVLLWCPDTDPLLIGRILNNKYRNVIERRYWYGLMTRGQITTPKVTSNGTAAVVNGSNIVTGINTTWTTNLIGLQYRSGFTNAWQTIVNVDPVAQTLQLDMPYGAQTQTTGYQIVKAWATMGGNIRYILDATNQQQGWRMQCNVPQQTLNEIDTWRTSVGWSYMFANMPPTPDGQLQIEIYPTPFFLQVFPYLGYIQPPNLVKDSDCPVTFIRADVLVMLAIGDALLFRGKTNKYYDPQVSQEKNRQAEMELQKMERNDDAMYQQDSTWDYGLEYGYTTGQGSLYSQSRPVSRSGW